MRTEAEREGQRRYKLRNRLAVNAKALARYYARHEANKVAQTERARERRRRRGGAVFYCCPRSYSAWIRHLRRWSNSEVHAAVSAEREREAMARHDEWLFSLDQEDEECL